jgi:hypothetical protein
MLDLKLLRKALEDRQLLSKYSKYSEFKSKN